MIRTGKLGLDIVHWVNIWRQSTRINDFLDALHRVCIYLRSRKVKHTESSVHVCFITDGHMILATGKAVMNAVGFDDNWRLVNADINHISLNATPLCRETDAE